MQKNVHSFRLTPRRLPPRLRVAICCFCCLTGTFGSSSSGADTPARNAVSFRKDVAPILLQKCVGCHGPEKSKGHFRLDSYQALRKGGETEAPPAIQPGDAAHSRLFQLITTPDEEERMPQKDDPLPVAQIDLIRRWIDAGALFDGSDPKASLISLVPGIPYPDPPDIYPRAMPIRALAFDASGHELASGGYHEVIVWDTENGRLLRRIKHLSEQIHSLAYSPDGSVLAVAGGAPGQRGEVNLVFPDATVLVTNLATAPDLMLALAFCPDGSRLAAAGADNAIRLFDMATREQTAKIEQHADWILDLAFTPDGKQIVSASRDKSVRVCDAISGELETTYLEHGEPVFAVAVSVDGKTVFSAGRDKRIHIWELASGKKLGEIPGFEGDITGLICDERFLYSCCADGKVRQQSIEKKKPAQMYAGHSDVVYALAFHPMSGRLASGSFDGEVRIWDANEGKLVRAFRAWPTGVASN